MSQLADLQLPDVAESKHAMSREASQDSVPEALAIPAMGATGADACADALAGGTGLCQEGGDRAESRQPEAGLWPAADSTAASAPLRVRVASCSSHCVRVAAEKPGPRRRRRAAQRLRPGRLRSAGLGRRRRAGGRREGFRRRRTGRERCRSDRNDLVPQRRTSDGTWSPQQQTVGSRSRSRSRFTIDSFKQPGLQAQKKSFACE